MIKFLYAMPESLVNKYLGDKESILIARSQMTHNQAESAKEDLLKECRVYDFDPENPEDFDGEDLYTIKDRVARIPIYGMLVQKYDICSAFFGETLTTYRFIRAAKEKAEKDINVDRIAYFIDSNGGVLPGMEITFQSISESVKHTYAIVFNSAQSAGYALASAADEIILVSKMSFLGSIGVAMELINRDKEDEAAGIKRTVLTNRVSADKRPDETTDEGQSVILDELDSVFGVFKSIVLIKRNGQLTDEKISELSGKSLIAEAAVDYGLADKIIPFNELDSYLSGNLKPVENTTNNNNQSAPLSADGNKKKGDFTIMKIADIIKDDPEAAAEHKVLVASAVTLQVGDVVKLEREKISKVLKYSGVAVPEAVLKDINDGVTLEAFMEKELSGRKEKTEGKPDNTSTLTGFDKKTNQLPAGEDAKKTELQTKADNAIEKRLAGKKGKKVVNK